LLFVVFELVHDVFSQLHDIPDINVAAEQGVAYFFEAFLDSLLIYYCCFVEFLQGRGDLSA
jgi:hypothetical protein